MTPVFVRVEQYARGADAPGEWIETRVMSTLDRGPATDWQAPYRMTVNSWCRERILEYVPLGPAQVDARPLKMPSDHLLVMIDGYPPGMPYEVTAFHEPSNARKVGAYASHPEKAAAAARYLEEQGLTFVQVRDCRVATNHRSRPAVVDAPVPPAEPVEREGEAALLDEAIVHYRGEAEACDRIGQAMRGNPPENAGYAARNVFLGVVKYLEALRSRPAAKGKAREDDFECCGGSDEHPPQHCQDCPEHAAANVLRDHGEAIMRALAWVEHDSPTVERESKEALEAVRAAMTQSTAVPAVAVDEREALLRRATENIYALANAESPKRGSYRDACRDCADVVKLAFNEKGTT